MSIRKTFAYFPESLIGETGFDAFLVDFGFCPGERAGCLVVTFDEGIDMGLGASSEWNEAPYRKGRQSLKC